MAFQIPDFEDFPNFKQDRGGPGPGTGTFGGPRASLGGGGFTSFDSGFVPSATQYGYRRRFGGPMGADATTPANETGGSPASGGSPNVDINNIWSILHGGGGSGDAADNAMTRSPGFPDPIFNGRFHQRGLNQQIIEDMINAGLFDPTGKGNVLNDVLMQEGQLQGDAMRQRAMTNANIYGLDPAQAGFALTQADQGANSDVLKALLGARLQSGQMSQDLMRQLFMLMAGEGIQSVGKYDQPSGFNLGDAGKLAGDIGMLFAGGGG